MTGADEGAAHLDQPRSAFATKRPCVLVKTHAPAPVITEYHHSKPVYLQRRLYGEERYDADTWLCSNCHEAVHAWLYWLLRERAEPKNVGRAAKAEAYRTYMWYLSEKTKKETA